MDRQMLEKYTQNYIHHGLNSPEVLDNFMNYQKICSDPLLVFRYMEEKAICTFLPAFWIKKAEIYAEIGDYSNCFECIEFAWSRTEESEKPILKDIEETQDKFRRKMIDQMKKHPLKTKRTVSQFNMTGEDSVSSKKEKQGEMLKIYEEKYGSLKREKEAIFQEKLKLLPKSWLFASYEKEDEKEKMIQEKIHQNSVKISKDVKYHSMHTPIRARDPQRLTKTMDSVEILKKKRSTRQKSKKNFKPFTEEIESEPDHEMNSESCSRMMVSLPVGKKFASVKRRVTFKNDNFKTQKIRNQKSILSFEKIEGQNESEKMEEESNALEIDSKDIQTQK